MFPIAIKTLLARVTMALKRYGIELAMFVVVFTIDLVADSLQNGLGVPVLGRVVTNVAVFLSVIFTYLTIRVVAARRLKRSALGGPISDLLFKRTG